MLEDLGWAQVYPALCVPLLVSGVRAFARWADGGHAAWLAVGVLVGALGIDALRALLAAAEEVPAPWAGWVVLLLALGATWALTLRTWFGLGRPKPGAPEKPPAPPPAAG